MLYPPELRARAWIIATYRTESNVSDLEAVPLPPGHERKQDRFKARQLTIESLSPHCTLLDLPDDVLRYGKEMIARFR
jgi:hypothetical protein